VSHFLDVHAAFGGDDHGDAAGRAVNHHREVVFLVDIHAVGDIEAVDLLAGLARLHGDEGVAEHLLGEGFHFLETTQTGPPKPWAALTASSTVKHGVPRGTATPYLRRISLP